MLVTLAPRSSADRQGGLAPEARLDSPFLLAAAAMLYILVISFGLDDRDFLRSTQIWQFGFDVPVASGFLDLPVTGVGVTIVDFFLVAPVVILALHVFMLARVRQRLLLGVRQDPMAPRQRPLRGAQPVPNSTIAVAILAGPAALVLLQRAYVPFAAVRPAGSWPISVWGMSLYHLGLVGLSGLAVLVAMFWPPDAWRLRVAGCCRRQWLVRGLFAAFLLGAATALPAMRPVAGYLIENRSSPVPPSVLLAGIAILGLFLGLPKLLSPVLSAIAFSPGSTTRFLSDLPSRAQEWRPTMQFQFAAIALAALGLTQMTSARALNLSDQTLADVMPPDALVAAYVSTVNYGNKGREYRRSEHVEAWERAFEDHAQGLDLSGWRLRRARFDDSFLPNIDFSGADLHRASFDGARFIGAGLSGADLSKSSLRGADFSTGLRLAQNGSDLNGAIFTDDSGYETWEDDTTALPTEVRTLDQLFDHCATLRGSVTGGEQDGRLSGVDFTGANLSSTTMYGMDFTKVKSLRGAVFHGADLRCAIFACVDVPPDRTDVFKDADLRGADFRSTKLAGQDLSGATFSGANFGPHEVVCPPKTDD